MKATEFLAYSEFSAGKLIAPGSASSDGVGFVSRVTGKKRREVEKPKRHNFGVLGLIVAIIGMLVLFLNPANFALIPAAIMERLFETFDTQRADTVESMMIIFQRALKIGEIPKKTAEILKEKNFLVGFIKDGNFVESNKSEGGELVIKDNNKIISQSSFINEVHQPLLYSAFNEAVLGGINSSVAYYFDDAANDVIKKYSSRNNFSGEEDFDETMNRIIGNGSDISINGVSIETSEDEDGKKNEPQYIESNAAANSKSGMRDLISGVVGKITGGDKNSANLNCASVLNVADTVSRNDKAIRYYLGLMENISKMKVGEGNESKVAEIMDHLVKEHVYETNDVLSLEPVTFTGSALESPSLYAVLSGKRVDYSEVKDFASDGVLKVVENKLGGVSGYDSIISNVASVSDKAKGVIGRLNSGSETCDADIISSIEPIMSGSLIGGSFKGINGVYAGELLVRGVASLGVIEPIMSDSFIEGSFKDINGVYAGELLVRGAASLGAEVARQSGGTTGDEAAVAKYNNLSNEILALDAKVDRMNRSPFDITSKNTFLGSIVYNMAFVWGGPKTSIFTMGTSFMSTVNKSFASIFPSTLADGNFGYLSNFGDCETPSTIGAVGSVICTDSSTFDTSTLDDPFNNPNFVAIIEQNTTLNSSGNRTVKEGSMLENYLKNTKRTTPAGVVDGGILESLDNKTSSIPFVSSIVSLVKKLTESSQENKKIASGAVFVNSESNPDWETYKYLQRYISIARAQALAKWVAGDEAAYNNIPFLEGTENSVMAFFNNQNQLAGNSK